MMSSQQDDWFTCPVCGEVVQHNAPACPYCGADEQTGWSEDAEYDGVDLPDDSYGRQDARHKKSNVKTTLIVAVMLALVILLLVFGR